MSAKLWHRSRAFQPVSSPTLPVRFQTPIATKNGIGNVSRASWNQLNRLGPQHKTSFSPHAPLDGAKSSDADARTGREGAGRVMRVGPNDAGNPSGTDVFCVLQGRCLAQRWLGLLVQIRRRARGGCRTGHVRATVPRQTASKYRTRQAFESSLRSGMGWLHVRVNK